MCTNQHDIAYEDLNPTILFFWKGRRIKPERCHCHDHVEMGYILSGSCKVRIDEKIYTVSAGDLLVFNPKVMHEGIVTDPENPSVEFFVAFTNVTFCGAEANHFPLPNPDVPIIHTETSLRQQLNKLSYAMISENESSLPGKYYMQKAYLIQFLLTLLRAQQKAKEEPADKVNGCVFESPGRAYVIDQIVDYFNDHYNEKISLDQISKNMYLSPFYISKIFKEETGETPINYLIKIRLEKARDLLDTDRGLNIREVATQVGYEDVYHFSKLFKKYYGVSPMNYKKQRAELN